MPRKPFIFFEDVPVRPVIAAITGAAERTVEARHFQVEIVKSLNVAGRDHVAQRLERLGVDCERQPADKALSDDPSVGGGPEKLDDTCLRVTGDASEGVLRISDARHAEVIYRE